MNTRERESECEVRRTSGSWSSPQLRGLLLPVNGPQVGWGSPAASPILASERRRRSEGPREPQRHGAGPRSGAPIAAGARAPAAAGAASSTNRRRHLIMGPAAPRRAQAIEKASERRPSSEEVATKRGGTARIGGRHNA